MSRDPFGKGGEAREFLSAGPRISSSFRSLSRGPSARSIEEPSTRQLVNAISTFEQNLRGEGIRPYHINAKVRRSLGQSGLRGYSVSSSQRSSRSMGAFVPTERLNQVVIEGWPVGDLFTLEASGEDGYPSGRGMILMTNGRLALGNSPLFGTPYRIPNRSGANCGYMTDKGFPLPPNSLTSAVLRQAFHGQLTDIPIIDPVAVDSMKTTMTMVLQAG